MAETFKSEPEFTTDPRLENVLRQLQAREPIFHRPELGTGRADFEAQMADDFWEIGASGRRYSRDFVLATLEERWTQPHADGLSDPWDTSDFHCRELGPETYALTYTLRQAERVTRRLTLWRREKSAWKILFHQGTVVAP